MSNNSSAPRYRDDVVEYADMAYQLLAAQISSNYLKYIKARVVPELGEFATAPLRELRTLMTVAHFANPIAGSKISRLLSYDPSTVSRSTHWLIENNLITVQTNVNDARSVLYGLTEKGVKLTTRYRELCREAIRDLNDVDTERPSRKEILKALAVLEKVRDRSQYAAQLGAQYKRAKARQT